MCANNVIQPNHNPTYLATICLNYLANRLHLPIAIRYPTTLLSAIRYPITQAIAIRYPITQLSTFAIGLTQYNNDLFLGDDLETTVACLGSTAIYISHKQYFCVQKITIFNRKIIFITVKHQCHQKFIFSFPKSIFNDLCLFDF